MQSESEAIGDDAFGMSMDEMIAYSAALESIIAGSSNDIAIIQAKYLLEMMERKLEKQCSQA